MTQRDYYEILGIDRNASPEEIKKSYRSLAFKFHPDRNPDDADAEERFKEATEAYEVLGNEGKRDLYNRYGHAGIKGAGSDFSGVEFGLHDALRAFMRDFGDVFGMGGMSGMGRGGNPDRGADLRIRLRLELEDVVEGVSKTIKLKRAVSCSRCHGTGGQDGQPPIICGVCQGSGQVRQVQRSFFGQFVNVGRCPECTGRGRVVSNPCSACHGESRVRGEATVTAKVPPGVDTGDYLTLEGEGDAGFQAGSAGDLHVVIEIQDHPRFQRHGQDLVSELRLGPAQAALGGKIDVPTLDGSATLSVPSGVQHGTMMRMKGKGLPPLNGGSRGNQFVQAVIVVPENLDKRTKELYQKLLELENRKRK